MYILLYFQIFLVKGLLIGSTSNPAHALVILSGRIITPEKCCCAWGNLSGNNFSRFPDDRCECSLAVAKQYLTGAADPGYGSAIVGHNKA